MIIDIFQYSNMYTLSKAVQWLADESHVRDECGPYVIRPGASYPDWPTLLHLYSRLKPGVTVFDWMTTHQVRSYNIDVRRFVTFGVIKGFLQRVHRWPILLPGDPLPPHNSKSGAVLKPSTVEPGSADEMPTRPNFTSSSWTEEIHRGRSAKPNNTTSQPSPIAGQSRRLRKHSAAESVLEQLYTKDGQYPTQNSQNIFNRYQKHESNNQAEAANSAALPSSSSSTNQSFAETVRPRFSHSPSAPGPNVSLRLPPELGSLLDGEHHTDELCTRFQVGWPTLEEWLIAIGEGRIHGNYGRVIILYK
jgi:hypothetical protein